jgi:hypothetical protein
VIVTKTSLSLQGVLAESSGTSNPYSMMQFRADNFTNTIRNLAYLSATLTVALPNLMATAQAQSGPTANGPYKVSVFAPPSPGLTFWSGRVGKFSLSWETEIPLKRWKNDAITMTPNIVFS